MSWDLCFSSKHRLKTVNYYYKALHLRCLRGSSLRLRWTEIGTQVFLKELLRTILSESLFNKFAGQESFNFIKKRFQDVFSCEYCKIFKNKFFYRMPPVVASIHCFPVKFAKSFRTVFFCWTPCDCHFSANLAGTTVECWSIKITFRNKLTKSWTNTTAFNESGFEHGCFPFAIYLFIFNNGNTITKFKVCLKLTLKTSERHHWCRFSVFIVNLKQISYILLLVLLITLNK